VAYDYLRGEPRAKFKKTERKERGDCIDCHQCVKVCPVGIDIRNGTQMECTNCTACIDACDHIMEKVDLPKGLIRYASENSIQNKQKLHFSKRIIAYSVVLLALIGILAVLLLTRRDIDTTIFRTPGLLYQEQENGMVSNLYSIKLINKTHKDAKITLKLEDAHGSIKMIGKDIVVGKVSKAESAFFVFLRRDRIRERKTKLFVGVYEGGERVQTVQTTFMGPLGEGR